MGNSPGLRPLLSPLPDESQGGGGGREPKHLWKPHAHNHPMPRANPSLYIPAGSLAQCGLELSWLQATSNKVCILGVQSSKFLNGEILKPSGQVVVSE